MQNQGSGFVNEIMEYAGKCADIDLRKKRWIPAERRDDLKQDAMLQVWRIRGRIQQERPWKSLVSTRVKGAILDSLRSENKMGRDGEHAATINFDTARFISSPDDGPDDQTREINYRLLWRLAGMDQRIFVLAMICEGKTEDDIAKEFSVSRVRIAQLKGEAIRELRRPWTPLWCQVAYALGICEEVGIATKDYGVGNDREPINPKEDGAFQKSQERVEPVMF